MIRIAAVFGPLLDYRRLVHRSDGTLYGPFRAFEFVEHKRLFDLLPLDGQRRRAVVFVDVHLLGQIID